MVRTWFRVGMLLLVLAILAVQTNLAKAGEAEQEREVTLKQLPAKVKATMLKAAGKNEIKEVEEVVLRLFEVEWTKGEREIEVLIRPDGKVLMKKVEKDSDDEQKKAEDESAEEDDEGEIDEKEIGMDDLPAKVKATAKKLAGKNKIELEQLRMKFFEAEWMEKGKEVEILVTVDGKIVKTPGKKRSKESKAKPSKTGKTKGNDDEDDD